MPFAIFGLNPSSLPPRLFLALRDVSLSGFRARAEGITFVAPTSVPRQEDGTLAAWLADAELLVVRLVDGGWVERKLEIPEFPLTPSVPASPANPPPIVIAAGTSDR